MNIFWKEKKKFGELNGFSLCRLEVEGLQFLTSGQVTEKQKAVTYSTATEQVSKRSCWRMADPSEDREPFLLWLLTCHSMDFLIHVFPVSVVSLGGQTKQWLLQAGMVIFRARLVTLVKLLKRKYLTCSVDVDCPYQFPLHPRWLSQAIRIQSLKMFFHYLKNIYLNVFC